MPFSATNYPVAYTATSTGSQTGMLTGLTVGRFYRITTTSAGSTVFTGGGSTQATTTTQTRNISGGTWPGPGSSTTMYLQESPTGATGTWTYTNSSATITRAVVPAPTSIGFTDGGGFNTTDVTMAAAGGTGTYRYGTTSNGTFTAGATITGATRGVQLTRYAVSDYTWNSTVYTSAASPAQNYTPPIDTTPAAISFTNTTNQAVSSIQEASVTITGINANTSISVSAGSEYKIGTGSYTTTAGTLTANNLSVTVRHTASNQFNGITETVLTVGGVNGTFQSTTYIPTLVLDPTSKLIGATSTGTGTWDVTGAPTGAYCRFSAIAGGGATAGAAGNATGPATAGQTLTLGAVTQSNKLPTIGTTNTVTYKLQVAVSSTGTYVDSGVEATVRRLAPPPTVDSNQSFDTTAASNNVSHTIALVAPLPTLGTLNYAISTTASTYANVSTWQASAIFTVTRGTTYYFWARTDVAASSASVQQLTVPYATGVGIDTAVAITTSAPTTSYINGVMPATETSASFSLSGGSTVTQYALFKDLAPHSSFDNATSGTLGCSGGGLPLWGYSNTYSIQARLSPNFGGDPNGSWTAATGTLNGTTLAAWTMARKVYDPTFNSVTLKAEFTQLATAIVNATASNGTLHYGATATGPWSNTSNEVGGYTRSATANSATVYIYSKGVSAGTDSNVVSQTWSPFFNQPDLALLTLTVAGETDGAIDILNQTSVSVAWTGQSAETYYRGVKFSPTPIVEVITELQNRSSGTISSTELPVEGETRSYRIQGRLLTTQGGDGTWQICTVPVGYANPFTITRLDDIPDLTALGQNVSVATTSTNYYATFSSTVTPGTTSPGTGYTVAGINTTVDVSVTNGQWRKNAGAFSATAGSVVAGDIIYFLGTSSSSSSTTIEHSLTVGEVTVSFTTTTPASNAPAFPNLAGNVANAALNTYYYATFTTTAAGTTSPGTGYTLNDIGVNIAISATNGQFYTTSNTNWRTSDSSVAPGQVVYFRALTPNTGGVQTTHSLTMGATPTRSFTTTTVSDITPEGYTNLAGNVTSAALDTYYYATFSSTTAGTTANGSSYTLSDINQPITITSTNGDFSINAGSTWQTSLSNVAKDSIVYFRGKSSATAGNFIDHSLTLGATTRTFRTTTAQATNKAVGTVTVGQSELTGGSTSNVSVSWTPVASHEYQVVRTDLDPDVIVIGPVTTSPQNLLYAETNDLPLEGIIAAYKIQVRRTTANGGDNIWYDATGTNITWNITRIKEPIVNDTQIFDTSTNSSTITHTIDMKNFGVGGTTQYAVSTSSTYNTSLVHTWQSSRAFVLTRQNTSPYFFWARNSTDAADADSAGGFTVPAYVPSIYGIQVWASNGTSTIIAPTVYSNNLINVTTTAGGGTIVSSVVLNYNQTSANLYIEGITTSNTDKIWVFATHSAASFASMFPVVTRYNGYVTITSRALSNGVTHYIYAGRVA